PRRGAEPAPSVLNAASPPETRGSRVTPLRWWERTVTLAACGAVLMCVCLPPLDWWPLGWIAPLPWLLLARQEKLGGRRPYLILWLAGFGYLLVSLHWLRLPHPVLYLGWAALCFYLAFYVPLLVALTRIAVHRFRLSIVLAAPLIWFGFELARGHIMTGFTMGTLGHSQYHWLDLIQISDIFGSYGVSALLMFGAACVARMLPWQKRPWTLWPAAPLAMVLAAVLGYGHARRAAADPRAPLGPRIGLIQGSFDVEVKTDPRMNSVIVRRFYQLSREAEEKAQAAGAPLDLLVWPETMYRYPLYSFVDGFHLPPEWQHTDGTPIRPSELIEDSHEKIRMLSHALGLPLLIGIERLHGNERGRLLNYNSAILVNRAGEIEPAYDKMHLVMFGEYIPFTDWFPWLYDLTPVSGGAEPGAGPVSYQVGNARIAPNICYETTIPHLIRNQVVELTRRGEEPDILINVTNDGWFRGSNELDMHLACGVFRAVECRKPLLIAANTGFSAWIDANGQIIQQARRQQEDLIVAQPRLEKRASLYLQIGDWPAGACLLFCAFLAGVGLRDVYRARRAQRRAPTGC
ncbi:MAG TPA: apolipoprotein N-acyltransferase, partial [Pirellulales bacterium]|nr:apolipoprotein N-acyltransferase [Pirellulales bacterium]